MAPPAVAGHGHRVGAPPGAQPSGVYRPRRPRASPLYGLLDRRFRHLSLVYDERFAHTYGPWRAVVPMVVDRFLACGILEHGFALIRCDACAHEYLLAFSCKSRYFCPAPTASTAVPSSAISRGWRAASSPRASAPPRGSPTSGSESSPVSRPTVRWPTGIPISISS